MTNEFLDLLLAALSDDQAEAASAYTKLRNSLVRFFQIKDDFDPDDAADETIDRVGLKLSQNAEIDDVTKYSFGVARFVYLERLKRHKKEKIAAENFYSGQTSAETENETDDFAILRECFELLETEEKNILRSYFADLSFVRLTEQRQRLTGELNMTLNNLRIKVFRLRQRLEKCVRKKSAR